MEMARRRKLPETEIKDIQGRKAVGEAFGYYFDRHGEAVYATSSIGIRLKDLKRIKKVIAVAGGKEKAKAIMAAVNPLYQDILITDGDAAQAILKIHRRDDQ